MSFGLYAHYPYCRRRCSYCDFSIATHAAPSDGRYAQALSTEMAIRAPRFSQFGSLSTIYVGGGTPSLWSVKSLARWLEDVKLHFPVSDVVEITLEFNPEDVTLDGLMAVRDAGVNRVSLGAQSLDDKVLRSLNRVHCANDVMQSIAWIKESGFINWNVDLMYGVTGQTLSGVLLDARRVFDLDTPHLSMYELSVEPSSSFGHAENQSHLVQGDEELVTAMYQGIVALNEAQGRRQYEVSCAALPGFESQHNLGYWQGRPYLGLGAGAHGFFPKKTGAIRFENTSSESEYLDRIAGALTWADLPSEEIGVSETEYFEDLMMTGLGLREGIRPSVRMKQRYIKQVERLVSEGLMHPDPHRWRTTARGRLMLNFVIEQILVCETNVSE